MMIPDHPCKKDCPDRNGTCKKTCEKLKEYTKKKMAAEKEKKKQFALDDYQISSIIRRNKRGH